MCSVSSTSRYCYIKTNREILKRFKNINEPTNGLYITIRTNGNLSNINLVAGGVRQTKLCLTPPARIVSKQIINKLEIKNI